MMQQTFWKASKSLILSYDSQDDGHNYKRAGNVNEVTNQNHRDGIVVCQVASKLHTKQ